MTMNVTTRESIAGVALAALLVAAAGCGGGGGGGSSNRAPVLTGITANPVSAVPGDTVQFHVEASDPEGDALSYSWYVPSGAGVFPAGVDAATVSWIAPDSTIFDLPVQVAVRDPRHLVVGTVQVDIRLDAPVLALGPDALNFGVGGVSEDPGSPPEATDSLRFAVKNLGGSALHWDAASDSSWLNLVPASGVTSAGGRDSVLVVVDRAALAGGPSGPRGAGIRVTSDGGDALLPVAVWIEAAAARRETR